MSKNIKLSVLLNIVLVIVIIGGVIFGYFYFTRQSPFEAIGITPPPVFKSTDPPSFKFAIYGNVEKKDILSDPLDVLEVDRKVYVSDSGHGRVAIFNNTGGMIGAFGKTKDITLDYPYGLASDGQYIYVADKDNIYRAGLSGKNLELFLNGKDTGMTRPGGMDIYEGKLFVVDIFKNQLIAFDLKTKEKIFAVGRKGQGKGEMFYPNSVAVNPKGEVYVTDSNNNRIQVFSSSGEHLRTVGAKDNELGKILTARGIAFDAQGNLYVTAGLANKILIYDNKDKKIIDFGSTGEENQKINLPNGLSVGEKGLIYITELGTNRVAVFQP